MRALAFFAFLASATQAHAGMLGVPALSLDAAMTGAPVPVDVAADVRGTDLDGSVENARRTYIVPQRYAFAFDETRAFWFAAGTSAGISLGVHVLIGLPTGLIAAVFAAGIATVSPVAAVPLLVGFVGTYFLLHAVGTGVASALVFNGTSDVYDASILSSIGGHVVGDVLAAGVTAVMFGAGGMLLGGLNGLAVFTGSAGLQTVVLLSVLGALPAVVIAGTALVVVPALIGAWAIAVSARPAEGYAPAPDWKQPVEGSSLSPISPSSSARDARAVPLATFALDVPSM